MPHPIVKVVADEGCQSYVVGCPETREALIVDPKHGRAKTYEQVLERFGLRAAAAVDTHSHADHLSDSARWLAAGLPVFMAQGTSCERPVTRVGEGDEVRLGRLRFRVLEVPGHTPDSIALFGHGMVLAGDTLFAGSLARADFRGSNPARLFDSVRSKLLALPDDTVVFPGHGYRDLLFTTIGVEKRKNAALAFPDGEAYARSLGAVEGAGNTSDVDRMLAWNAQADPQLPDAAAPAAACCAAGPGEAGRVPSPREIPAGECVELREAWTTNSEWIDVRDAWEVAEEAIPGAVNIPLGELGFHLDELAGRKRLLLSCLGGVRSLTAARTLRYLDAAGDPISMAGGFRAWKEAGGPVVTGT